jgi:signal transduction histidine kinase
MDCSLSINTDLDGLDEQTNITIYRIVQECLTNIAKHANARSVVIEIDRVAAVSPGDTDSLPVSALKVSIRDDGVGMDPEVRGRGLGLIGMRERAGALGGMLGIETTPGQGMTVVVTLPLEHRQRSQ